MVLSESIHFLAQFLRKKNIFMLEITHGVSLRACGGRSGENVSVLFRSPSR